jgi:hypothetical protein
MFELHDSRDVQGRDVVPVHLTDYEYKFGSESSEHRKKGGFGSRVVD